MTSATDLINETMRSNISTSLPPESTEPDYWPDFGALQYLEVIYLTIITVLGTIGNLIVMFSIALEKRVHAHGNIFIINLAIADLIVSAVIVPTVIANVIAKSNALEHVFCSVIGFLVTSTCTCSLCNLMFIAVNRYWAVVRPNTYPKMFPRRRVYFMVAFTWLWSALLVSPTVLGWGGLKYDGKMMICSWDDSIAPSYTYFITFVAIFMPLCIIAFCYFRLFATVRGSGRWVRSLSVGSGISQNNEQHRRSMRKERSLLKTLLTTVLLFCCCWVPFGACVLINPTGTPKHAKKIFGWLALTNSCVNFIIYGAMNPVFRRGYHNLFLYIFRCKRVQFISSTMLHGSFSDSFRSAKKGIKGKLNDNGFQSRSDTNRDNSRIDTVANGQFQSSQMTQTTMATKDSPITQITRNRTTEPSPLATRNIVVQQQSSELEMGDDTDDEFFLDQEARYSRRAMSDIPASMNKHTNNNVLNSSDHNLNHNNNVEYGEDGEVFIVQRQTNIVKVITI
ncbi:melatonin receptor type 1C-like isoform X2 [Styela clava]|uniref:melatonin receptor type 1C-like isoform X2 n=1 Tax=Styela clava TaxID=7725 RepID=UPI00193A83E8|nr:melatonin receptor type 1C-like isoform X2 [Styela clava]